MPARVIETRLLGRPVEHVIDERKVSDGALRNDGCFDVGPAVIRTINGLRLAIRSEVKVNSFGGKMPFATVDHVGIGLNGWGIDGLTIELKNGEVRTIRGLFKVVTVRRYSGEE